MLQLIRLLIYVERNVVDGVRVHRGHQIFLEYTEELRHIFAGQSSVQNDGRSLWHHPERVHDALVKCVVD